MSKNLVLCCDGTCNEFGETPTNVVRLYQALDLSDPLRQVGYYDPGVGTMGEPGMVSKAGKGITRLLGAAFGLGITANVTDACRFLMQHWEPGDRIYIFGFSRGAFTARIVAAMVDRVGILRPGLENLLPYAVRLYRKCYTPEGSAVMQQFKDAFGRPAPVHFLGLWDSVSSVGSVWAPVGWPNTAVNPGVSAARHAIAIDERRGFYRQNRMKALDGQDIQQRWYPGAHSDVGGGYPTQGPGSNTLWCAPFTWVVDAAVVAGMIVDPVKIAPARQPASGLPHRSLKGFWWPLEIFPKLRWDSKTGRRRFHLNLGKHRTPFSGELLDSSVRHLFNTTADWKPRALEKVGVTRGNIANLHTNPDGTIVVP